MKRIEQTYSIRAPLSRVWRALTDPKLIEAWSGAPAEMSDEAGAKFSLWDGDVYGTNTKVVPQKLLEQEWYGGEWDKPSKVVFSLSGEGDRTVVMLVHTRMPEHEAKDLEQGWRDYYLGALKNLCED
jgi:uncharacterized protein YndB with AHSA1/START domain